MESIFSEETGNTQEIQGKEDSIPKINPKNPFENFTEYEDYNSDYREIVPQIDIPGCVIPFKPSKREKKKIRHYFNAAGLGVLLDYILAAALFNIIVFILQKFIMKADGISSSEITSQYLAGLQNFLNESSISIGLCAIIYPICHTLIFLVGSKATKIKTGSYFQTTGLTFGLLLSYFTISIFLRMVSGAAGLAFSTIFKNLDTTVGTFDFHNTKAEIITLLYGCILAPITEELLYRGFVLKNMSRVSQRFGIMSSALLFGLMHGNFNQFFMAFIVGIFFAHIDVKHNSLLPSMIIHALSNMLSFGMMYSNVLNSVTASFFVGLGFLSMSVAGAVILIRFYKKNRLPYTMPHQKIRNGTIISSVLLIAAFLVHLIVTIGNSFPTLMQ